MIICEFCKKELSTVYNLKVHQSKTRKCINIQNQLNIKIICTYCNNEYKDKIIYNEHLINCKNKSIDIINELQNKNKEYELKINELQTKNNELKEEITDLKNKLDKYIDSAINKPTTITNNNTITTNQQINNLINLTDDHVNSKI